MCIPSGLLQQAVRRLLGNARDASAEDVPVDLSADVRDNQLNIRVSDKGEGMSADVLARAAEPFFTTKEPGRGTGLGLFFVQSVVSQLGGRLAVSSVEGSGTSAVISLSLDPQLGDA